MRSDSRAPGMQTAAFACVFLSRFPLRDRLAEIADLEYVMKFVFQERPKTESSVIHCNGHRDVHSHVIIAAVQMLNE